MKTEKKNGIDVITSEVSQYQPTDEEQKRRAEILFDFTWGHVTMYKPRREFNDLSIISRLTVDKMSFNAYQPNDGDAPSNDITNSWKSRAMKPIIRNKIMSIAAHATARLLFPKIFAYNQEDEEEAEVAVVLESLQEWAADRSNYAKTSLYAILTALWSPSSIVYTEYVETYREVKREKVGGKWRTEKLLDEDLSGFIDEVVPRDELYIENWYEPEIQRQGWLLRRKVQSYSLAKAKYAQKYENFKYVKPGIQIVYDDANQTFYEVYDTNMRFEMVEEITYWRKSDDIKIIMVNGVMLTDPDNPNPRNDKMYPFDKFVYSTFDEGRAFDGKSLAFHMTPEAKIVNTLYPMMIDGTYLSIMPPMVNIGGDVIGSDVIIPGAVTTLQDPGSDLKSLSIGQNYQGLKAGMEALNKVEDSLNDAAADPANPDEMPGNTTAYEISVIEKNAATVLGLFIKMISDHVRGFGRLRINDILQYLTLPEVKAIEGKESGPLVYKTFYLYNKGEGSKTRKIKFTTDMPDHKQTDEEDLNDSLSILEEEGGLDSKQQLFKVNPAVIRMIKYMVTVTPDVLNPMSDELERAFGLEEYDRMIVNPTADQEEAYRMLLSLYPKTKKDPDKYIMKQGDMQAMQQGMQPSGQQQNNNPLQQMQGQQPRQPAMPVKR